MRAFITGAAGFLGLHLTRYFSKKGAKLTLYDIAPFPKDEYPRGAKMVKGDVRDKNKLVQYMAGADVVIHAAAALPLWKTEDIMAINIEGTKNALAAARVNKVGRFIYVSSTAVYGVPKKHPIFESDRRVGVGPYGISKIAAEKACEAYQRKGLTVSIIRPKTFVGTHRLGVFEILFDWIKDNRRIPVIGNGENRYQLLDVDDLCEAIYLLSVKKQAARVNDTFNIGAAEFHTVKEDLGALFKHAHSRSRIQPTPAVLVKKALWVFEKLKISPLYQWVYDTADKDSFVSIDKLTKTLAWKPRYANAEALIKSYDWYKENYRMVKSATPGVTHTVGWNQGVIGWFKRMM